MNKRVPKSAHMLPTWTTPLQTQLSTRTVRKLALAPEIDRKPAVLFNGSLLGGNEDPRLKADEI
jgi:hypothetical protein